MDAAMYCLLLRDSGKNCILCECAAGNKERIDLRRYTVLDMRRAGLLLICTFSLFAQTAPSADGVAYFEKNIRPLLSANCYACHSEKAAKPMGGLLLDSQ